MKKLYNILFQNEDLGEKSKELYYRSQELIVALKNKIIISDKSRISFDTYFNSFSIDKWRKYTTLNTLYLYLKIKGNCTLTIKNKYLSGHDLVEKIIKTIDIREEEISEKLFEIENINKYEGIFYFEIFSYEGETILYEASYQTENNVVKNKISVGITICTFRREEYIERMLNKYENENLDDSYKMFIVDNGKTLEYEDRKNVFFFKNKNYGGAGGFTRGIIEIQKYNQKNEEKISHILLMDDDILFDFRVLERMKSFLELKKGEFNNYFIAGSMCSLDHPEIQYESYASWRGRFFTPFKHNVNLFDVYKVLMNEKEEKYANGTAGWWFSCFSVDIIGKNNYPFPCFFRGDDVEFTIRNESKIINLNGLNVWHEPFYKKYSIVSENYYLLRNMLVVNALYTKMGYKDNIRYLTSKFIRSIMYLNYNSAKLVIRALKDFSKGVSFFEETNPEELNGELMKLNPKMDFIWNLIEEYKLEDIYHQIQIKNDKNKLFKILRLLSFNGYLIPKAFYKEFGIAQLGFAARPINFYKTKKVLNYDIFSQKAYFSEMSKIKAIKLAFEYSKECIKYYFNFKKINKNYQENFYKIQNIDFWKKYLELEENGE